MKRLAWIAILVLAVEAGAYFWLTPLRRTLPCLPIGRPWPHSARLGSPVPLGRLAGTGRLQRAAPCAHRRRGVGGGENPHGRGIPGPRQARSGR